MGWPQRQAVPLWAVGASMTSAATASVPASMLWNGKAWRKVPVPGPAGSFLAGAAFIPGAPPGRSAAQEAPSSCTAPGQHGIQVKSPPDNGTLRTVAATSTGNARAVGFTNSGSTLILHWNGTTWS